MIKKSISILIFLLFIRINISVGSIDRYNTENNNIKYSEKYEIQGSYNFGSDWSGDRFQGPQPIGDCDNDGKNEINAAPVFVKEGLDYISWIFKYK